MAVSVRRVAFVLFSLAAPLAGAQYALDATALCGSHVRKLAQPDMPGYPVSEAEFKPILDEALKACSRAVTERPGNQWPHLELATAMAFSGDWAGAAREAKVAADLGAKDALTISGAMAARGQGAARDMAQAVALFREGAKGYTGLASYNLGALYATGDGVAQDLTESFRYYMAAARAGDAAGMLRVAHAHATGRGVGANPGEAANWWRKVAEKRALEARPHPARLEEPVGVDPGPALAYYRERAAAGEAWAETMLGTLYERGYWVAQDYAAAMRWYQRAAERGHPQAEGAISHLYSFGRGVAKDSDGARRWAFRFQERQCEEIARAAQGGSDCDRYAADPYDPQRVTAGMPAYCIRVVAERGVSACRKALESRPNDARLRAQLARSLVHVPRWEEGRREAESAAKGGSTAAMVLLGALFENGYGVAKDPAAALQWYERAAARDDERAMRHVLRIRGEGAPEAKKVQDRLMALSEQRARVPVDPRKELIDKAQKGDRVAQHNLAASYESGTLGARDLGEAVAWYRKASDQGYGASTYNLAQMHEKGMGVPRDAGEAARLYRKLAEAGPGEARLRLAMLELERGNTPEAVRWLNRMAAEGEVRAMLELGILYDTGRGVARDRKLAMTWFERAAGKSVWAEVKLGAMHSEDGNHAAALSWWRRAAGKGDARALNNLGVMQERGLGMPADLKAAVDLYLRAARAGSPEAAANLEAIYDEGRGEPASTKEAIAWYQKGAELGLPSAQFRLGQLYEKAGPTQDYKAAYVAYNRASGDPRAARALARMHQLGLAPDGMNLLANQYAAALLLSQAEKMPARKVQAAGFVLDPGADPQRTMQVRVASVPVAAAAPGDLGWMVVVMPPVARPAK